MVRKVYLNKRSGAGGEVAAVAAILLVVALAGWFLYRLFWVGDTDGKETLGNNAGASLPASSEPGGGCDPVDIPGFGFPEFKGSDSTCSTRDAAEVWSCIRKSPYVSGNKLYATVLNNTAFAYDARNDAVNAFATSIEVNQVRRPLVCLLGGAARFAQLIAYARALDIDGVTSNATAMLIAEMTPQDGFSLPESRVKELKKKVGIDDVLITADTYERSKMIERGVLLGILAHEAGHQAYGHVHNQLENRKSQEISRNQERDADSFCSSVMSSSPYGKYMFEGTVFWWWVMACQETNATGDQQRSHPLSRERFENIVRANKKKAAELGLLRNQKSE